MALADWLAYDTIRVVKIKSKKLGLLHYAICFVIIVYIAVWVIWVNRGYQASGYPLASVLSKVKGAAYYEVTGNPTPVVMDSVDTVLPALENNAAFVTTHFQSVDQVRGVCTGEDPTEQCPCTPMRATVHGVETGVCNTTADYCQLHAWCPVESRANVPSYTLNGVTNMTLFLRVTVRFPTLSASEITSNGDAITSGLNLWTIGETINTTGYTYEEVAKKGMAVAVLIDWECNLDHALSQCDPQTTFVRLDNPDSTLSSGFNFRYARYGAAPANETRGALPSSRELYKVDGVRYVFLVTGVGRKFDVVPLMLNIASGLALLSLASLSADFLALNILKRKEFYRANKYLDVDDPDPSLQSLMPQI